jgi:hypothetical protein
MKIREVIIEIDGYVVRIHFQSLLPAVNNVLGNQVANNNQERQCCHLPAAYEPQ